MTTAVAIIPAGGVGRRMGLDIPKQYLELAGLPVLVHTVRALQSCASLSSIVIAAPAAYLEQTRQLVRDYDLILVSRVVAGGSTRQESVRAALACLPAGIDIVVVHDGVRPLIAPELVEACILQAAASGAAMAAIPVKDTLKAVTDDLVTATVERAGLWQAQTPQAAQFELLLKALQAAAADGFAGTDEASLLERIGVKVRVVMGSEKNIKITRTDDLLLAETLLAKESDRGFPGAFRVGHGYDTHQLVKGRKLVLGGVTIPHEFGLLGHSDADVLLHALCDAILGALGLGDLGRHFPDNDLAYKGISSLVLLEKVIGMMTGQGYRLVNADVTMIAQEPKLSPHFPGMLDNIGRSAGVDTSRLNLKATTTEKMGFAGRGEGIAAHAVVSLAKISG